METPTTLQKIEEALNHVRPALLIHRGNVEFVSFDEPSGVVKVRLQGSCVGCPMSTFTMKLGIEKMLIETVPGVREVVDVTEVDVTDSEVSR